MKGITILANHNTKERIAVFLNPNENNIQRLVNEKFGGNWVQVDDFCLGDMLRFESVDTYSGFDNRDDDNYCQGALIKK